jgi:uncharacterized membrane protein required for colicin V production
MIGSLSLIDILFLVTLVLLAFNGFKNGAVISLVNLISIPLGFVVAVIFGPQFTTALAANGWSITPLISYIILFFGTVLVMHIIGSLVGNIVKSIPLLGPADALLGGVIGVIESWLLWLVLLIILGTFLHNVQDTIQAGSSIVPGLNIQVDQFKSWHDFYNQAVTNSLFAKFNSFFNGVLTGLPKLPNV